MLLPRAIGQSLLSPLTGYLDSCHLFPPAATGIFLDITGVNILFIDHMMVHITGKGAMVIAADCFCFVIMTLSGNPLLQELYEQTIKPVVEDFDCRCERVDEQEFNGSIRDRILKNIREARFIIADVTEARPNCYYELGVAHALEKEVIHLANSARDIHFDVKDFNFIIYHDGIDLERKLRRRIRATVSRMNRS